MAIQNYDTSAARIGKMAGEIIGHAMATEVLVTAVTNKDMPKNKSDTIIFRSWVPFGATSASPNKFFETTQTGLAAVDPTSVYVANHLTTEGVTPAADTITPRDVTVTLQQFMALYSLTDKDFDLYEDDVAEAMKEQTGQRMGLLRELVVYGKMKACTNKFFAGAGTGASATTVASRVLVAGVIQERHIAKVVKSLKANHGKAITKILSPSTNVGTRAVEAGYVCYVHTDAEFDIRALPGFIPVAQYGSRQPINEWELGTWNNVRFVLSPELQPYPGAGAGGTPGTAGAYDVYPFIFLSQDAFAAVKLRGQNAIDPIYLPPNQKDKNDPGGQRGYIGAKFWMQAEVLNQGWMAVLEANVTAI